MLIALLAVLGVDLIVLVAFVASALTRKRWVKRQPGSFRGGGSGRRRRGRWPAPELESGLRALGSRCPRLDQGAILVP
jgi:hypothetical protein